jgi:hypothetical protein
MCRGIPPPEEVKKQDEFVDTRELNNQNRSWSCADSKWVKGVMWKAYNH